MSALKKKGEDRRGKAFRRKLKLFNRKQDYLVLVEHQPLRTFWQFHHNSLAALPSRTPLYVNVVSFIISHRLLLLMEVLLQLLTPAWSATTRICISRPVSLGPKAPPPCCRLSTAWKNHLSIATHHHFRESAHCVQWVWGRRHHHHAFILVPHGKTI